MWITELKIAGLLICLTAFIKPAEAQLIKPQSFDTENFQVGLGGAYGTYAKQFGLRADAYYQINDIRFGITGTYYLPKIIRTVGAKVRDDFFSIDINGNYILNDDNPFLVYAIFGLNITNTKKNVDYYSPGTTPNSDSKTILGLNLGAGLEYNIDFCSLFGEVLMSGVASDANQIVPAVGIQFYLSK